jgi:hypothetical protein
MKTGCLDRIDSRPQTLELLIRAPDQRPSIFKVAARFASAPTRPAATANKNSDHDPK